MSLRIDIGRKLIPATHATPGRLLFRNFRLDLAGGEVCAVTGASGIGKSTLLQIVAGLDRDFDGTVQRPPEPTGYLFQNPRLLPWRTVRENLELVVPDRPHVVREWLERVELGEAGEVYPQRLSVGMARRVALARALMVRPSLLLLDEPFAALDPALAQRMARLLADELRRLRPTTLLVIHSPDEAQALADRVIVLAGSPTAIVADRSSRKTV
jgi:ABC-type nitrate/sulfonate/bicarbonate transport system ATPase subunit